MRKILPITVIVAMLGLLLWQTVKFINASQSLGEASGKSSNGQLIHCLLYESGESTMLVVESDGVFALADTSLLGSESQDLNFCSIASWSKPKTDQDPEPGAIWFILNKKLTRTNSDFSYRKTSLLKTNYFPILRNIAKELRNGKKELTEMDANRCNTVLHMLYLDMLKHKMTSPPTREQGLKSWHL